MTRAGRRRSSRSRDSVAGRSRARSLSRHSSQMARDGIGEPNVRLARELSLSDAPPLDLPSSTTAAAHLRPPQRSRVRRPAGSQPSAANRSNGSHGVQSQLRSLARAECAADPARAGEDVLSGCAMLRWPQHGCMARRGESPSWIRPRGLGNPGLFSRKMATLFCAAAKKFGATTERARRHQLLP